MVDGEKMLIQARRLRKRFYVGEKAIEVLHGVDLSVEEGAFISIMGTSGSGKSTLLHILGGLTRPEAGSYCLDGRDMLAMTDNEQSWIRAHWIGFVFQTFDLLNEFDVIGNVSLPFLYNGIGGGETRERVLAAIDQVGLTHRKKHRPVELSGGEMQRVAIARALAVRPKLILADEPTGNLDSKSGLGILSLFTELNGNGTTVVLVTHDPKVANISGRIYRMEDGSLVGHDA